MVILIEMEMTLSEDSFNYSEIQGKIPNSSAILELDFKISTALGTLIEQIASD
jgi:hypothetical protein